MQEQPFDGVGGVLWMPMRIVEKRQKNRRFSKLR